MSALRETLVWLFRSRQTGRLTVLQWPNIPLAVYLLAKVILVALRSGTAVSTVVAAVASAALAVWAVLEVAWGVNPFRRGLGCVVLIFVIVSALRHADAVSNTATTLSLFADWATTPVAGSAYSVSGTTTYYALAKSTGPGPAATWNFFYGQYDGSLFHNEIAANSTSHATNGAYTGGPAGTVVIDLPLSGVGNPAQGAVLVNDRTQSNGGPPGDAV